MLSLTGSSLFWCFHVGNGVAAVAAEKERVADLQCGRAVAEVSRSAAGAR